LKDKENKKQKEKEEKEKHKQERVKKRQKKEELAKKQAEQKKSATLKKTSTRKKRPATTQSISTATVTSEETIGGASEDYTGDDCEYECTECFGSYQNDAEENNGAEWVQCGCGQWLHEDCIDKVMTGEDGRDRMCSSCVL